MLRKWAVNLRLENNNHKIPKEAQTWVFKTYAQKCDKRGGYYHFLSDGSLVFIGCPGMNGNFANSFGWFPKIFPYDDPFQAIHKGMTAEEFAVILQSMGFEEI